MARRRDRGCPCGLPATYEQCCGRFHVGLPDGVTAPTAELLMRSRYSAFAVEDADYLLATWHPVTRPASLGFQPGLRWARLQVLESTGGLLDTRGTVHYRAHWVRGSAAGVIEEDSLFRRDDGRWAYVGPVPS